MVPKGFNLAEYGRTHRLDDNAPVFLKDGYIIVNFNIETIRNQDLNHPHLQYKNAPLDNQWRMEGFQRNFVDPYGATFSLLDGDVVFYHANLSSYDDYGTGEPIRGHFYTSREEKTCWKDCKRPLRRTRPIFIPLR
ncbi:hypothetical protein LJK88_04325 [Paenibacillus sp. P26]|nr:hypothetical protein LJK88_04325 [Paenibacillus sp. P26]UUZ90700.1 hypothetical protein LJK87_33190 [Paenibacillus sp. P25]